MGRRRGSSAFPVARIKKMMQSDDDVGKIATTTPVLVAKALECMMEDVLRDAANIALDRRTKTVTPQHLKQCVSANDEFDFLRTILGNVPSLDMDGTGSGRASRAKRPRSPAHSRRQLTESQDGITSGLQNQNISTSKRQRHGSHSLPTVAQDGEAPCSSSTVVETPSAAGSADRSIASAEPSPVSMFPDLSSAPHPPPRPRDDDADDDDYDDDDVDTRIEDAKQTSGGSMGKENFIDAVSGTTSQPSTEPSALHLHMPTSPVSKSAHVITYPSSGLPAAKTVPGPGSSPAGLSPVRPAQGFVDQETNDVQSKAKLNSEASYVPSISAVNERDEKHKAADRVSVHALLS